MDKIKQPIDQFIVVSRQLLEDKISPIAKYLMIYMMSLGDDWEMSVHGLSSLTGIEAVTVKASLTELNEAGYIIHNDDGYQLYYQPQSVVKKITNKNISLHSDMTAEGAEAISFYEQTFRPTGYKMHEDIKDLVAEFGLTVFKEAVKKAKANSTNSNQKLSGNYIRKICENITNGVELGEPKKEEDIRQKAWDEAVSRKDNMNPDGWSSNYIYKAAKKIDWTKSERLQKQLFFARIEKELQENV